MQFLLKIALSFAVLALVQSLRFASPTKGSQRSCKFIKCHVKSPVCGSDGKTYRSLCELLRARCKQQKDIKVLARGKCPTCDLKGPVHCLVPGCFWPSCPAFPKAVCVSFCGCDSQYFYRLQKVDCHLNPCKDKDCGNDRICKVIIGKAVCILKDPCKHKDCGNRRICKVVKGKAICVLKDQRPPCGKKCNFGKRYSPVCGSDKKTYRNPCEFLRARCKQKKNIKLLTFGKCPSCDLENPIRCLVPGCFRPSCPAFPKAVCVSFCGCDSQYFYRLQRVDCRLNPCKDKDCGNDRICKVVTGKAVCILKDPCKHKDCGNHRICKVVKGKAICVLKDLCKDKDCGIDGVCRVVKGKAVCVLRDSRCSLPKVVGPCKAKFKSYYYNSLTGKCELFYYGGCRGNRNNFKTKADCESECKSQDVCSLPKVVGPCEARIERYFYDTEAQRCEKFYYGGCQGNENNFNYFKECEIKCPKDFCKLRKEPGPCRGSFPRYFYNSETQKCEKFVYGGCRGNKNNFITIEDCENKCKPDICALPKETGPCKGSFPRYFYNSEAQNCEKFIYGGCGGNKNNFVTIEECKNKCKPSVGPCALIFCGTFGTCTVVNGKPVCVTTDVCSLPQVVGPCKGNIPRFYYNSKNKKCEKFFYGGCGGNQNNFLSLSECNARCPPPSTDICLLPSETGPCRARILRYFYNSKTGKCEEFVYGGCLGNKNNFITITECENQCKPDLCASIRCRTGTECKVILGKPLCRPVLANPCIAATCPIGSDCIVVNREAKCVPKIPVLPTLDPLCAALTCVIGSTCVVKDGKASCATACSPSRTCKQQGSVCNLKLGACQCQEVCPAIFKPVCDSNYKRYDNQCRLDAAACSQGITITTANCYGKY